MEAFLDLNDDLSSQIFQLNSIHKGQINSNSNYYANTTYFSEYTNSSNNKIYLK